LNIINGILFVQISQQDIDSVKQEFEKRQKEADLAKTEVDEKSEEDADREKSTPVQEKEDAEIAQN
jgi:hypothetical protein